MMRSLVDRSPRYPRSWWPAMKLFAASGLAAVALLMLLGFFMAEMPSSAATMIAGLLAVVLPAAGAGLLAQSAIAHHSGHSGRKALLRRQRLDTEILRVAAEQGGRLTALEVASQLGISPEEAKRALDDLLLRQDADPELTDAGIIVYHVLQRSPFRIEECPAILRSTSATSAPATSSVIILYPGLCSHLRAAEAPGRCT